MPRLSTLSEISPLKNREKRGRTHIEFKKRLQEGVKTFLLQLLGIVSAVSLRIPSRILGVPRSATHVQVFVFFKARSLINKLGVLGDISDTQEFDVLPSTRT